MSILLKWIFVLMLLGSFGILVEFEPEVKFLDHSFDGYVSDYHPRIVLPELHNWKGNGIAPSIQNRLSSFSKNNISFQSHCLSRKMLFLVSCWVATNDNKAASRLIKSMLDFHLIRPKAAGEYSNGWKLALAYDLFFPYLLHGETKRFQIEEKIYYALRATLTVLDENSASLWHGRSSHAAIAWLCAIVLPNNYPDIQQLRTRAQGHFWEAVKALRHTEAWPEGYNYWIQNRAFLYALASSAYINGLEGANNKTKIRDLMKTVGYWHIYATRPDNRIEGFGDEGSRVDLKDETRRVIDLIVGVTRDPVLAGYSKYLQQLHGNASYYRGYQWGILLFNDPTIEPEGDGSLESLSPYLLNAKLFGKDAVNYAYFRSGWKKNDTFVSFKAGHSFAHHGHYDAGHFTLFKGAPLAINSSVYSGFFSENRLNYSIRTVAKNSLLVLRPDEGVQPNYFFYKNVSDGGQRIIQPTGSSITSLDHWFENFYSGLHFEGATLVNHSAVPNEYHYISTDLTSAYNNTVFDDNKIGGKVKKVLRDLLYLPKEDQLIIYDRVVSTDPKFTKKWLLHTVNRPQIEGLKVLQGSLENGISESYGSEAKIQKGQGYLKITRILPTDAVMRVVGGKDYQYYVESDGDDTILDGKNFYQGALNKQWFDIGLWRMEVQPSKPAYENEFLLVLSPSLGSISNALINQVQMDSESVVGIMIEQTLIIFVNRAEVKEIQFELHDYVEKIMIFGLIGTQSVVVSGSSELLQEFPDNNIYVLNSEGPLTGNVKIKVNK